MHGFYLEKFRDKANVIEFNKFIQFISNQLKPILLSFDSSEFSGQHVPQFVCILRHISLHVYNIDTIEMSMTVLPCTAATIAKHQAIKVNHLRVREKESKSETTVMWPAHKLQQNNLSCVSPKNARIKLCLFFQAGIEWTRIFCMIQKKKDGMEKECEKRRGKLLSLAKS